MTSLDPAHLPPVHSKHGRHHTVARTEGAAVQTLPGGLKVPDLRFEQGYLKAISPYVPRLQGKDEPTRWKGVAWVTFRDQLLSPLIQGILVGAAGALLVPLFPRWKKSLGGKKDAPIISEANRPPLPGPVPVPWWQRLFGSLGRSPARV